MIERAYWPRMGMIVLALVGIFDATYLYISRLIPNFSMVCPVTGGGCEAVRDSAYSVFPPSILTSVNIPVATLGMIGYGLIFVIGLAALHTDVLRSWSLPATLVGLSSFGVAFSAYLVSVQAFIIRAFCSWCLLSAILMTCIWLLALYDRRELRAHRTDQAAPPLAGAAPRA